MGLCNHFAISSSVSQSFPLINVCFVFGGSKIYAFLIRVKFMFLVLVVGVAGIGVVVPGCIAGAAGC